MALMEEEMNPLLQAILNCYSPDDTISDYQDKIRAQFDLARRSQQSDPAGPSGGHADIPEAEEYFRSAQRIVTDQWMGGFNECRALKSAGAAAKSEQVDMLRDMLAIQEACGLHTDEYAPGSVIEYIKELEGDGAAGAGSEPAAAQFKMPNETWEACGIDEEEAMRSQGYKFRFLYAAPSSPSAGELAPAANAEGRVLAKVWYHPREDGDYDIHDSKNMPEQSCPECVEAVVVARAWDARAPATSAGEVSSRLLDEDIVSVFNRVQGRWSSFGGPLNAVLDFGRKIEADVRYRIAYAMALREERAPATSAGELADEHVPSNEDVAMELAQARRLITQLRAELNKKGT